MIDIRWSIGEHGIEIRFVVPEGIETGLHYSVYPWSSFVKDLQGTIRSLLNQIPGQLEVRHDD